MISKNQWHRITALHEQGCLHEAEAGYREILQVAPDHTEAIHMLGMLLHQRDQDVKALDYLERALILGKNHPSLLANTAKVYIDRGVLDKALELLGQALRQDAGHFGSLFNQALALKLMGRPVDALSSAEQAASRRVDNVGVHLLRAAILFGLQRYEEEIIALNLALEKGADHQECMIDIAAAWAKLNDRSAALEALADIEPTEISVTELVFKLALIYQELGAWVDAIDCLNVVISQDENHVEALLKRGVFTALLGVRQTAIDDYQRVLSIAPSYQQTHSNLLIQLQYDPRISALAILAAHQDWAAQHASHSPRSVRSFTKLRDPERQLNIGLISPRFDSTLVSSFLPDTLAAMPADSFNFLFYNSRKEAGSIPSSLTALGATRLVDGLSDEELAQQLCDDGVDILIDLAGHNPANRMVAISNRLAPIQMCWLDYFSTTGVPAVDYLLTDRHLTPADSECHFTESLIHLPQTRLCYSPPDFEIKPQRSNRAPGEIIFGSFNRPGKLVRDVVKLWAGIVNADENSSLLLKAPEFKDKRVREFTLERFRNAGLASSRIELRRASPYQQMLEEYADIDIALDPFSFTGCATSCDALWMGVPVVTLPGDTLVSRQGLSILNNIGQSQWIASDRKGYRDISLRLAARIREHGFDRSALRSKMEASPLCDVPAQASALSDIFRFVWKRYCKEYG